MRIVFMGTGEIAIPAFEFLLNSPHQIVALICQPDKAVGRHQTVTAPLIKQRALQAAVPVLQPDDMRSEQAVEQVAALQPELIVVMAYGQILTQQLIDVPSVAIINLHASLLPAWRGASCIQAAIANGDSRSGVSCMHVVRKLDAGAVIHSCELELADDESADSLHDKLAALAVPVLEQSLLLLQQNPACGLPQDESLMTYAPKLLREHGRIDWNLSADVIARRIRAYDSWPGSFCSFVDKRGRLQQLKLFAGCKASWQLPEGLLAADSVGAVVAAADGHSIFVRCAEGFLQIFSLQQQGSKRQEVAQFLCGHSLMEQLL